MNEVLMRAIPRLVSEVPKRRLSPEHLEDVVAAGTTSMVGVGFRLYMQRTLDALNFFYGGAALRDRLKRLEPQTEDLRSTQYPHYEYFVLNDDQREVGIRRLTTSEPVVVVTHEANTGNSDTLSFVRWSLEAPRLVTMRRNFSGEAEMAAGLFEFIASDDHDPDMDTLKPGTLLYENNLDLLTRPDHVIIARFEGI